MIQAFGGQMTHTLLFQSSWFIQTYATNFVLCQHLETSQKLRKEPQKNEAKNLETSQNLEPNQKLRNAWHGGLGCECCGGVCFGVWVLWSLISSFANDIASETMVCLTKLSFLSARTPSSTLSFDTHSDSSFVSAEMTLATSLAFLAASVAQLPICSIWIWMLCWTAAKA